MTFPWAALPTISYHASCKIIFSSPSPTVAPVDKYGRPLPASDEHDSLKRFYRLDSPDAEITGQEPDYARGEGLLESSDEEDNVDDPHSGDDGSEEDDGFVELGVDLAAKTSEPLINLDESELAILDAQASAYQQNHPDQPSIPEDVEQTNRLAIVNLDWDHVRATHLFKVCSSLVSPTASAVASTSTGSKQRLVKGASATPIARGKIHSVAIYPSQFGKERLAREEKEGPPPEIFKKKDLDVDEINEKNIYEVGDADQQHDEDALRSYQLERLRYIQHLYLGLLIFEPFSRYYYAIVTCDTIDAAAHVYEQLQATEFERSANIFDLSFVPNDMEFDEPPRYRRNIYYNGL